MLVENALGIAGRPRGIAEHAGLALRALDPGIIAVLGVEQGLERAVVEADVMVDGGPLVLEAVDDRLEQFVVEEDLILGMVGDVDELLVEQARIDRVDDAAHADRAVPGDQVIMVVHGQGADPVAALQAHLLKRLRELPRIACDAGPAGALDPAVGPAGDDFASAVLALGMVDEPRHAQLEILHPAQHSNSPAPSMRGSLFAYETSASLGASATDRRTARIPPTRSIRAASSASTL